MHNLLYFLIGLLFGLGLITSGMSDPAKVQGFLDLAGAWDPSLAVVMASAVGVGFLGFGYAKGQPTTWLGHPLQLPTARHLDGALVGGSALFGIGWGACGHLPGTKPNLVGCHSAGRPSLCRSHASGHASVQRLPSPLSHRLTIRRP